MIKKVRLKINKEIDVDNCRVDTESLGSDIAYLTSLKNITEMRDSLQTKVDTWDNGRNLKYDLFDYRRDFKILMYLIKKVEKKTKRFQTEDSQIKRIINHPYCDRVNDAESDDFDLAATLGGSCS